MGNLKKYFTKCMSVWRCSWCVYYVRHGYLCVCHGYAMLSVVNYSVLTYWKFMGLIYDRIGSRIAISSRDKIMFYECLTWNQIWCNTLVIFCFIDWLFDFQISYYHISFRFIQCFVELVSYYYYGSTFCNFIKIWVYTASSNA